MVSIFDVTPQPFDPKHGLNRIDEFNQTLRNEAEEDDRRQSNVDPRLKQRKQSAGKGNNESMDDAFKRQLKAAKNVATTCQWVIQQVAIGRVRNTFQNQFEAAHFCDISITQLEMQWLQEHDTVEKVLCEYVLAYAAAPKWEPFPKTTFSAEDLQRIEDDKAKYSKEVEEAKTLAQALLVRLGGNTTANQHLIEYGNQTTQHIADQLSKKRKKKSSNTSTLTAVAEESSSNLVQRCDVIECIELRIDGYCGNSGCSHFRFCSLHLAHSSHMNHQVAQRHEAATAKVAFLYIRNYFVTFFNFFLHLFILECNYLVGNGRAWWTRAWW